VINLWCAKVHLNTVLLLLSFNTTSFAYQRQAMCQQRAASPLRDKDKCLFGYSPSSTCTRIWSLFKSSLVFFLGRKRGFEMKLFYLRFFMKRAGRDKESKQNENAHTYSALILPNGRRCLLRQNSHDEKRKLRRETD